jgi:hypothetical protein
MTRIEKLETKNTSWENEKINFFVEQFVGIKESLQSSHSSFKESKNTEKKMKEAVTGVTSKRIITDHWV